MVTVHCQSCGEEMAIVADDYVERRIQSGDYTRGGRVVSETGWDGKPIIRHKGGVFGICSACKRAAAALPIKEDDGRAQSRRIQARLVIIRERRPDLTLEQAAHAATEDEFDPHNEPNLAFRAYLLERSHLDPAERSLWRKVRGLLREVFGPHAGGVA